MSGIISQVCTTVQGEGPSAGEPCLLIRLGNCNLNCDFCDTKWTNNLKLNEVPNIKTTIDSLPIKIETNEEMKLFMELCAIHIKEYNISRVLITGGEPFMNNEFLKMLLVSLRENLDIKIVEIETNGILLDEQFFNRNFPPVNIQLNISPKLNSDYYPSIIVKGVEYIIELFKIKNRLLNDLLGVYPYSLSANYKFVYSKDVENDITKFIEEVNPQVPISIMPLTPDYLTYADEFTFIQDFRDSCYDSIDYCLRTNYSFSARLHVFVFNNFKHRNEFEDIVKI